MAEAGRDEDRVPSLLGVSSADDSTPVPIRADPTTKRLLVDLSGSDVTAITGVIDNEAVERRIHRILERIN